MRYETMLYSLTILVALSITTLLVVDRVIDYKEIELSYQQKKDCEELWQPPNIPQCDKETWDRIREGCDNETSD